MKIPTEVLIDASLPTTSHTEMNFFAIELHTGIRLVAASRCLGSIWYGLVLAAR